MSRFVSSGTDEQPQERSQEWLKAQQAIEAKQLAKKMESQKGGDKSLYETLQANKAAKEDAFQESIKLKNQFRALDEDEVDFLASVNEATRKKEAAVQKETAEELDRFKEQREQAERASRAQVQGGESQATEAWTVKKRKREAKHLPGFKVRKASSSAAEVDDAPQKVRSQAQEDAKSETVAVRSSDANGPEGITATARRSAVEDVKPSKPATTTNLGLGDYSSDED